MAAPERGARDAALARRQSPQLQDVPALRRARAAAFALVSDRHALRGPENVRVRRDDDVFPATCAFLRAPARLRFGAEPMPLRRPGRRLILLPQRRLRRAASFLPLRSVLPGLRRRPGALPQVPPSLETR